MTPAQVSSRRELLKIAVKQRCVVEQDWSLKPWQRLWFTAKSIAAVLLGREETWDWRVDRIEVAHFNPHHWHHFEFGDACDWDSLKVRRKGLAFSVESDGYP